MVRLWTDDQLDRFADWWLGLRAFIYLGILGV